MEVKKTPRANLENRKSVFFLMGLVLALSAVFTAFEWGNRELTYSEIETTSVYIEEEDIEITPPEENTPPPPPPPEQPVVTDIIQVVEDDVKVDNVEILSVDDALDQAQNVVFTPPVQTQRAEETESNEVFEFLEEMPEYPGGQAAMLKFLQDKISYPAIAAENNIQGRVIVGFIVERDGSVSDVKVERGVDPSLDKEAVRVVKLMPKWKPGKQTGKPVRCRFRIPVQFRLRT